ncbi:TraB/GumN family protein [Maribellus maritimus]|uniref:TraB/GumN family protein n=1 Tax=Maribellus maritimus TaxID=2870838 RepID=UPI001EEA5E6B|nr:TraB/GumN family protein [Maribellus maritimus]MCG6190722.1 TraB/GumN family protein [Maribellus maritimus]
MKRTIISAILILVIFFPVFSQSSVYVIEDKNGAKIFVGGSIHKLREQDFPLPDEFLKTLDNSEILVLETDISEVNNPANAPYLMEIMTFQDDKTLKSVLSENVYNKLDSACANYGIRLEGIQKLKPFTVILNLTQMVLLKNGVTKDGVDVQLSDEANKKGKSFLYLETFEEQLSFMKQLTQVNEDDFVLYSLKDIEQNNAMFDEIIASWKTGDKKVMQELNKEFKQTFPEIYQFLLLDRNDNWIPQLEDYLKTPDTEFVVVGALHLYGPDGVLQQMKDKGYLVKQL